MCFVGQLCLNLCNTMDCSLPGSSVNADSSGKNTRVGCQALLQGIFPTQGWNPDLLHCGWILYQLSHQGSPRILEWVVYPFPRGSSQPRDRTRSPALQAESLPAEPSGKPMYLMRFYYYFFFFTNIQEYLQIMLAYQLAGF